MEQLSAESRYNTLTLGKKEGTGIITTGIAYIRMVFGADFVEKEELPYLGFLKEVLGYIDTKEYSYANLSTNINLNSGGLGFNVDSYPIMEDVKRAKYTFGINVKVLYDKIGWAFSMAKEIALHSKLGDKKRLKDIALEVKARTKSRLLSAGHITALTRAASSPTLLIVRRPAAESFSEIQQPCST